MSFANPHVLWLLLVLPPAMVVFYWWSWRKRQRLIEQFIHSRLLASLTVGISPGREKLGATLLVAAVALLVMAWARPQWGFVWEEARVRGVDIVVAVDVSKSMLAEDIAPNRLMRARLAVMDLVQQARSDRLGLVAFAGTAFLQCPLTIDDTAFQQTLRALDVNLIPEGGTAIGEAIGTALKAFKEDSNHKVLVLFTDGEDHDSDALEAAAKAAEAGVRIFTVGMGTPEGEILRVRDAKGRTDYIRDEAGNVVKSHLNEDLLRQIAGATEGGFYLPLRGAKTIETLYEQGIAPLPKGEHDEKLVKKYQERYHWPLGLAMMLLVLEFLLPKRKPDGPKAAVPGRAGLATVVGVLLLVLCAGPALASSSSALRKYRAGEYDEALQEYERLLRKGNDPRLKFNAGASAYRKGAYEEAAKHFSEALKGQDLNLQQSAYYNRGNTWYEMGEGAPEQPKKMEFWKKSVQDFESALKLNPTDMEAEYNRDFVKKRLQEIQQQQQQQQQGQQDEKQDSQQDKEQSQSTQGQEQQESQKQEGSDPQEEQQSQPQASGEESQEQEEQGGQRQEGQEEQPQPGSAAKEGGEQDESALGERQAEGGQPGKMTADQARQLLDSQKGEERPLPIPANNKRANTRRGPIRDW